MSSLFKLSIKGIRAFEPEQEETIQFGFPLTLICGQNGCGKTTIIECLKYATTGDLPPNSKGGAFVNDPSLTGRTNVTGQVKLAFRNANGKSMITTRTIQLSRKKGRAGAITNTFKTLEGQLVVIDKGNKVSVSSKNAELDQQTPIYLGASRAILDYVIFCHQDDSLWPLSEASVLKKRFDDIFEASKFTKVLDNLKVIKKDMTTDIKLIEQSVNHLKIDKDRAKKLNDRLKTMSESAEKYSAEIAAVNINLDKKEREADELFSLNQDFQATLVEYDRLKHEKKLKSEQNERLKNSIELLNDSEEELLHQQNNFVSITKEKEKQISIIRTQNSTLNKSLELRTTEYNKLIREDGMLKSKELEYNQNYEQLKRKIDEHSTMLSYIKSLDDETNMLQVKELLNQRYTQDKNDYSNFLNDSEHSEKQGQAKLQDVLDSITREEQHQKYCEKDTRTNKDKLTALKRRLDLIDNSSSEYDSKKLELISITQKLDERRASNEIQQLEKKIESNNSNVSKLEFEVEEISRKITTSNKQSDLRTRITLLEETITKRESSLNSLLKSTEGKYEQLVGQKLTLVSAESALNDKLFLIGKDIETLQKKVISVSAEAESTKAFINSNTHRLEEYAATKKRAKSRILSAIEEGEIETYESVVEELEESYRNVLEDINTSEVTRQFNVTAISIAQKEKNCLLCKRTFDLSGLNKFIDELQQSVNKDKIKEIEEQAESIKKELTAVKGINSDILTFRDTIKNEETLKSKNQNLVGELEQMKKNTEDETNKLKDFVATKEALESLKKPLNELSRLNFEIDESKRKFSELNDEINDFGTAVLSIAELQKLQQSKNTEIKNCRQQISDDTETKHLAQREISRLESKVKDVKLVISNLEKSLADVTSIKNSIEEAESNLEDLAIKKSGISSTLGSLSDNRDTLVKELAGIRLENLNGKDSRQKKLVETEKQQLTFLKLFEFVKDFQENYAVKIEENSKAITDVTSAREQLNLEIESNLATIQQLEKAVYDSSRVEHNIIANLDYRGLIKEIEEIENQLIVLDISDAQMRKEQFQERSKKLRNEITKLNAEHSGKTGELKQLGDQIKSLQGELNSEYKDVNSNYHEEWVKLQTNLLVSNDIQTYSKALDNAIMKFHSMKMEDINRILRELWSQTYKGSDIETIAIKSDVNVQAKGNRSYNYRVVMYKSGNELDMRGRCSAGQKVLTSILIRLALAECFGVNCGIIALDEPTTNLDQENTESLAEALNQIIEVRKAQLNFQLIVITHDENFLTHINGDRFTDHFYRIRRDEQQSSRIYSLPISKIHES